MLSGVEAGNREREKSACLTKDELNSTSNPESNASDGDGDAEKGNRVGPGGGDWLLIVGCLLWRGRGKRDERAYRQVWGVGRGLVNEVP